MLNSLIVKCPKCQSIMIKRNGKYGLFYGCTNYPNCKGILSLKQADQLYGSIEVKPIESLDNTPKIAKKLNLSPDQLAITQKYTNTTNNIQIRARAGSGKSTILVELAKLTKENLSSIYLVFAKKNNLSIGEKLPSYIEHSTIHSKCLKDIKKAYPKIEVDYYKVDNYLKDYAKNLDDQRQEWFNGYKSIIKTMISRLKNELLPLNDESFDYLINVIPISFDNESDKKEIINLAITFYNLSIKDCTKVIDADDMIFMVASKMVNSRKFNVLFCDEYQDQNNCRMKVLEYSLSPNGRIVIVGDDRQSIMGFTGANCKAMELGASNFNCDIMTMPTTFRNPTLIVGLVNTVFPEIEFKAAESAKLGKIGLNIAYDTMINQIKDNSKIDTMIICRNNAPLISICFKLLKLSIKCNITGKDIGGKLLENIAKIVKKYNAKSINDLIEAVQSEKIELSDKYSHYKNKDQLLEQLEDNIACILTFCEESSTIDDLYNKINNIFCEDKSSGITLSSCHKSKGLESEIVYLYDESLFNGKRVITDDQKLQESNLKYVSYTRSLNEFYTVLKEDKNK